ncbi:hypothetical protein OAC38_02495 [Candidatus Poseidoniaceae archaeon]|nr:hypothetical protein [Candidatus Poseidoniaceae archaeon]
MPQAPTIHLRGKPSSLRLGLVERLLRTEAHVVLDDDFLQSVNETYATDLEFGQATVSSSSITNLADGHRLVMLGHGPFTSPTDGSIGLDIDGLELILVTPAGAGSVVATDWVDAHVMVHDMIPMRRDPDWTPAVFEDWLGAFSENKEGPSPVGADRWWVSEIDVADALVRLLMSDNPLPETCKMSGRRSWSMGQTYEEFHLLYMRTMAGQTGRFGVEELSAAPTPTIELQTLVVSDRPPMSVEENKLQRPDLSNVHDALHAADGDGWRPLIPVRTSLMHCLAGLLDQGSS